MSLKSLKYQIVIFVFQNVNSFFNKIVTLIYVKSDEKINKNKLLILVFLSNYAFWISSVTNYKWMEIS